MTRVTACLRSELNQRAFARDEAEVRHHTTKESASLPDHYLKQLIGTTAANSNRCIDSEPSHSTPSILSQGLPWLPAQKSMALACASSHAARLKYPHACQPAWTRSQLLSTPKRPPRQQHAHHLQPVVAGASSSDNPEVNIEQLFASELANRQAAEAKQAEVAAAAAFDGTALLALLRKKYGRSYDVSLVQRKYLGKVFVALNIMWKYMEQQSFSYSEEQYMQRLEYVAAALVSWGAVTTVQNQLAATKERPRVGKAVSIMLDVPEEKAREWIAV